jgi:hypothetical protein
MSNFQAHNKETAQTESANLLDGVEKAFGFIPNLRGGFVSNEDTADFLAAGYTQAQILEVILGVTFKTLSNYTNHIAETPLDAAFAPNAWSPVETRLAS